jgi:hypothetical protein
MVMYLPCVLYKLSVNPHKKNCRIKEPETGASFWRAHVLLADSDEEDA